MSTDWKEIYQDQIVSSKQAISKITSGQRVFIGTGCAEPIGLVEELVIAGRGMTDLEVIHLLTNGDAPYAEEELSKCFRVNSFFISENVRDIIQEGLGDYTPIFLSDIPALFKTGKCPLDVALIQVRPPDEQGLCSLGISVDIVKSATENARLVIAEVNEQMPRTHSDSFINIYNLDYLVPVDRPLLEVQPPSIDEEVSKIGEYIAALVDDNSTVEFGIGQIPQAVIPFLKNKKNLGIHTEMISDSIIELVESGVITGKYKNLDRGKIVTSFALGTKKLYDFIDDNQMIEFHSTEYVNDPFVISQQHQQIAINVALEIDLTGQVCADSLGSSFYSGIGGQVDFNRGAARSEGGKAIIGLRSTAKNGNISRIVPQLSPGAGVVTTRGDVHYVVTEYGVAYLHGKSVQERALALISIAHPKFREEFIRKAVELKYISRDHDLVKEKMIIGPADFKRVFVTSDGIEITFRAVHPTDESKMKDLFYSLSQTTRYYRFMSNLKSLPQKQLQDFVFVDHRSDVAIVGTLTEAHGEDIVAIGRYFLDEKTNLAEVAFVVRDDWQNKGIGSFLFNHLSTIARRNGIAGFVAKVLRGNRPMQRVVNKSETKVSSAFEDDLISFKIDL